MSESARVSPFIEMLLGGSRIAPANSRFLGVPDCASDERISQGDMAEILFAYAFLQMREHGQVEITHAAKKVAFYEHHYMNVCKTGNGAPADPLSQAIFQKIVDGKSVYDTICAWYGKDVSNPQATIVNAATEEAIAAGYLVRAEPPSLLSKWGNAIKGIVPTVRPLDKRAEIENIRRDAAQKWTQTLSKGGNFVLLLLEQCRRAMRQRTLSSD